VYVCMRIGPCIACVYLHVLVYLCNTLILSHTHSHTPLYTHTLSYTQMHSHTLSYTRVYPYTLINTHALSNTSHTPIHPYILTCTLAGWCKNFILADRKERENMCTCNDRERMFGWQKCGDWQWPPTFGVFKSDRASGRGKETGKGCGEKERRWEWE